ncbi:MAG TPA: hypothetical protein VKV28_11305 [Candidatus Binataceae bacterium]|nr:hypothetical protein [Candidatus Binataceae bacterium]
MARQQSAKLTGAARARRMDPVTQTHRRFVAAMERRLAEIDEPARSGYLTVMVSLSAKLEVPGKPISEIVRELMAEAGPLLFSLMRAP